MRLSIGQINLKHEYENSVSDESHASIVMLGAGIGMAISLGERATFDIMAGYSNTTIKNTEDNFDNYRTVMNSLGLKFGFNVFLSKN